MDKGNMRSDVFFCDKTKIKNVNTGIKSGYTHKEWYVKITHKNFKKTKKL